MKTKIFSALKVLWGIYDKKEKFNLILIFCLCASRSLSILAMPQVVSCLTAKFLGESTFFFGIPLPSSWSILAVIIFNFAALTLLWIASTFARAMLNKFATRSTHIYKQHIMKLLLSPRKNMDLKKSTGEIIFIIQSSSAAVGAFLDVFLIDVFPFLVSTVVALIYLATINFYISLGAAIICIVVFFISKKRASIDKKHFVNIDIIDSKISNNVNNCINNLSFIVFINSAYHELNLLKSQHSKAYKETKKQANILISYWSILYVFEYAFMALSLFLLIKDFGIAAIGVNTLILVVSYLHDSFSPVNDLGHFINILSQFSFRVCRLREFIPNEDDVLDINAMKKENKILNKEKIHKIEVKNMEVEIGSFHKSDINAKFEANKLCCIVGPSGSGKTTLIGCLLGLKEYKNGEIIVNNKYKVKSLFYNSSKIALTLQNSSIFDRSVMDNICYPQNMPNARAKKNIRRFGLEKLIARTQNINNSVDLESVCSGGERKRISFVRAISRPADIYIFDEPTNDLDPVNVEKILQAITKLKHKNIVIAITHDERLIEIADQVHKM